MTFGKRERRSHGAKYGFATVLVAAMLVVAAVSCGTAIVIRAPMGKACTDDAGCPATELACASAGHCVGTDANKHCYYDSSGGANCPCVEGETQPCGDGGYNVCLKVTATQTNWSATCVTCTAGDSPRCKGDTPAVCQAATEAGLEGDGTWIFSTTPCVSPSVCSNGACVECISGKRCKPGGNAVQTCSATGTWGSDTPCATGQHCLDGECKPDFTYYPDADGDGYGHCNEIVVACPPSTGWALQGGDCCPGDARSHPGADFQDTKKSCGDFPLCRKAERIEPGLPDHRPVSPSAVPTAFPESGTLSPVAFLLQQQLRDWDFNCDGEITSSPGDQRLGTCSKEKNGQEGWASTRPACGKTGTWQRCVCTAGVCQTISGLTVRRCK